MFLAISMASNSVTRAEASFGARGEKAKVEDSSVGIVDRDGDIVAVGTCVGKDVGDKNTKRGGGPSRARELPGCHG
jgi:hypothetical protein